MAKQRTANNLKSSQTPKGKSTTPDKSKKAESKAPPPPPEPFDMKKSLKLFGWIILCVGIIVGVSYLVYNPVRNYDMVYCDDNIFLHDYYDFNKSEHAIDSTFYRTIGVSYYRPMLAMSIIMDANIYENKNVTQKEDMKPSVFHRTNLFLHIFAACLMFLFFVLMRYNLITSFFFGMLTALHPILTPAVSWISGRNDSLITVFVLLSFIFLALYFRTNKLWYLIFYVFHMFFYACSLFTKEIASFLPVVCIIYIIMFLKDRKIITLKNMLLLGGWFAIGLIWFTKRKAALDRNPFNPDTIGLDALKDTYQSIPAIIGKIFFPVKMIALSTFEWQDIALGIVAIVGIFYFFFKLKELDKSKALFGILWFLFFMIPTLLVRIIYVGDFFDYAEHRAYLLLGGVFIFIAEVLAAYKIKVKNPLTIGIFAVILIIFGYRSYGYMPSFQNRTTFWQRMVDQYPYKSRGYLDLGKAYVSRNSLDTAASLYKKGIERNPDNFNLYIDLSYVYNQKSNDAKTDSMRLKFLDSAIENSSFAVRLINADPNAPAHSNAVANYNLARAYYAKGEFVKAIPCFEMAVNKQGGIIQWYVDLGLCYFNSKQFQKAVDLFKQIINAQPSYYLAHANLGASLAGMGKFAEAEKSFVTSIELNPKQCDSYYNLIRIYIYNMNQLDKATACARNAVANQCGPFPPDVVNALQSKGIRY